MIVEERRSAAFTRDGGTKGRSDEGTEGRRGGVAESKWQTADGERGAGAIFGVMQILVNGQPREVPDESTVPVLLERLGLASSACAVVVNRRLVPKRQHSETVLRGGDKVEVVTLVGGG